MMEFPRSKTAERKRQEQAEAFEQWLVEHQWTTDEFAEEAWVDRRRVTDWATGKRRLPVIMPRLLKYMERERGK